jgi:hypothetical protein
MVAQIIMAYVKLLHLNKYWNKVYLLCLHLHALASTSRCGVRHSDVAEKDVALVLKGLLHYIIPSIAPSYCNPSENS